MKRILILLLSLSMILGATTSTSVLATGAALPTTDTPVQSDAYAYAITPDSANWFEYTVTEKVAMLQIPESKLTRMTDAELVDALASYPYLVDIYLYGSGVSDGIEVVRTYCSALDALLNRETGLEAMRKYLLNYSSPNSAALLCNTNSTFSSRAIWDIFSTFGHQQVRQYPTVSQTSTSFVRTPNGTQVQVATYYEPHSSSYHTDLDFQEVIRNYDVEFIDCGSCMYNCHYFTWHLKGDVDADVHRWMSNPVAYMEDGSYEQIYYGNNSIAHYLTDICNGDFIFYGEPGSTTGTHSAITLIAGPIGAPLYSIPCVSKWGIWGVFRHDLGEVPYGYNRNIISAWRLAE